jgi:hypothetical protein
MRWDGSCDKVVLLVPRQEMVLSEVSRNPYKWIKTRCIGYNYYAVSTPQPWIGAKMKVIER